MRDPARIERITRMLKAIWLAAPDQRLGQLLENLVFPEMKSADTWEIEDGEVERRLQRAIERGSSGKEASGRGYLADPMGTAWSRSAGLSETDIAGLTADSRRDEDSVGACVCGAIDDQPHRGNCHFGWHRPDCPHHDNTQGE